MSEQETTRATRYRVHLTTSIESLVIYAHDWRTDGDNGAQFLDADGKVVAAFRSGFLVAIIDEVAEVRS